MIFFWLHFATVAFFLILLNIIIFPGCYATRISGSGLELITQKWGHSLVDLDLAWSTATEALDLAVGALAEVPDKGIASPLRFVSNPCLTNFFKSLIIFLILFFIQLFFFQDFEPVWVLSELRASEGSSDKLFESFFFELGFLPSSAPWNETAL